MKAIDADLFSMFEDNPVAANISILEKRARDDQAWFQRWEELRDERLRIELEKMTTARTPHFIDLQVYLISPPC